MGSIHGFLRGLKLGVGLARDISERQYRDAATESIRQPYKEEIDPDTGTVTSPLDVSGGTRITSPDTKIGKTETTSTEDEDTGVISGGGGRDVEIGSTGGDRIKGGGQMIGGGHRIADVEAYIRKAAAARGIDPDIAVRVARSEGLAPGVWQSNVRGRGGREQSYGPYQMLIGGMGSDFEKATGLSVRDPKNVYPMIDYALDRAATGGWGPWYGWKGDKFAGIRNAKAIGVTSKPTSGEDTLEPGDRLVDAGAIPEPEEAEETDSGLEEEEEEAPELASAGLQIEAPEIDLSMSLPEFEILTPEEDWATTEKLYAQGGGAIPDFTDTPGIDDTNKNNSFGWGAILGNTGLPQGGTAQQAGLGGQGDFSAPGGFANASYGVGAQPMAGWFNRDAADVQAAQQGRLARQRISAQQAAGRRLNAINAQHLVNAEKARQAALAKKQAADQAARNKAAAIAKAKADAAAKAKAAAAAKAKTTLTPSQQAYQNSLKTGTSPAPTVAGTSPVPYTQAPLIPLPKGYKLTHGQYQKDAFNAYMKKFSQKGATPEIIAEGRRLGFLKSPLQQTQSIQARRQTNRGGRNWQGGGAIPDPDAPEASMVAGFAKGGSTGGLFGGYFTRRNKSTATGDARFRELLAEEEGRAGGPAVAGETARDRAARRYNRETGARPASSTAYSPGGGGGAKKGDGGGTVRRRDGGKKQDTIKTDSVEQPYDPLSSIRTTPPQRSDVYDPLSSIRTTPPQRSDVYDPLSSIRAPAQDSYDPLSSIRAPASVLPPAEVEPESPVIPEPEEEEPSGTRTGEEPGFGDEAAQAVDKFFEETFGPQEPEVRPKQPIVQKPQQQPRPQPQVEPESPAPVFTPQEEEVDPVTGRAVGTPPPDVVLPNPPPLEPVPAPDTRVDHAAAFRAAKTELARGRPPAEVAQALKDAGIPRDLWPLDIQNKTLGFQEGGAIPEPESNRDPGYTSSRSYYAPGERQEQAKPQKLAATPKLRRDVAKALDGGLKFMKQEFMGDEGGIPTPEAPAMRAQGATQIAQGYGAADEGEIANIDRQVDPRGELAESDRAMLRLAKIHQFFLERGRVNEAGGAAYALMAHGAQRVARLGGVAAGAYSKYLETGDRNDLEATAEALEQAYDMIPNGRNADIQVTENGLQATMTDADGNTEVRDIRPGEINGLLQQAMNGSGYWREIWKQADKEGYQHELTTERQVAEDRRSREEWNRQHGITREEELTDAEAAARAKLAEEERGEQADIRKEGRTEESQKRQEQRAAEREHFQKLRDEALAIARDANKPQEPKEDREAIAAALPAASAAELAYEEDDSPENKANYDAAVTALYKAFGFDAAKVTALGYDLTDVDMSAEQPPAPGWTKQRNAKDNKMYWVSPDGSQKAAA